MINTVLFDLDGTLLDSAPDFILVLNQLLQQYDLKPIPAENIRTTVSDGASALVRLGFGIDDRHPEFKNYLKEFLDLYEIQIGQTQACLFAGISQVLQNIEQAGYGWGIVTNKPSRFTMPLLANFKNLNSCKAIICPDHVKQRKPDPEGLLLACQQLASTPQKAVYVGDHLRDIEAGRNAGMITFAANWGYFTADTNLKSWQADKIINTPEDISVFLLNQ